MIVSRDDVNKFATILTALTLGVEEHRPGLMRDAIDELTTLVKGATLDNGDVERRLLRIGAEFGFKSGEHGHNLEYTLDALDRMAVRA